MPIPIIVAAIAGILGSAGAGAGIAAATAAAIDKAEQKKAKNSSNTNKSSSTYKSGAATYNTTKSSNNTTKRTSNSTSTNNNYSSSGYIETFKPGDKVKFTSSATFYYLPSGAKRYLADNPAYRDIVWTVTLYNPYVNQYSLQHEYISIKVYYKSVIKVHCESGTNSSTQNKSAKNANTKQEETSVMFSVGDKVKLSRSTQHIYRKVVVSVTQKMRETEWTVFKSYNRGGRVPIRSSDFGEYEAYESGLELVSRAASAESSSADNGYKFTALGLSGSGKTCFMAGMYYKLSGGFEGYTLKASDDDDVRLTGMYEKMKNASAGKDRFPSGTNQTSKYSFDLQYQYDTIEAFEWVDYDGNALKMKNAGNAEAYQNLKKDISQSEILYIFVDGGLFDDDDVKRANNDKEKAELLSDIVSDECSRQINHFLSEYTKEQHKLPPIAIVVTKFDIVHEVLGKASGQETVVILEEIIKKAFNPLFPDPTKYSGVSGHTSMVSVIPVSLGATINQNDYHGKLRPLNMHLPIYMGIWFMLAKSSDFIKDNGLASNPEFQNLLDKQNAMLSMLGDELDDSGLGFFLNGQTGKFTQLAKGYLSKIKENN